MASGDTINIVTKKESVSAPSTPSPSSNGLFTRLKRSLTSDGYFVQKSPQTPTTSRENSSLPLLSHHDVSNPSVMEGKSKATAFERFMKLRRRRKEGEVQFPPPHWEVVENTSIASQNAPNGPVPPPPPLVDLPEGVEHVDEVGSGTDYILPPEPTTLAQRIQIMLSSLPSIFSSTPATSTAEAAPVMLSDPQMISFLSSPSVMNGSVAKGRQSVWSVLDRLKVRIPRQTTSEVQNERDLDEDGLGASRGDVSRDDTSSVMFYAPISPLSDSEVELAESEIICDEDHEPDNTTGGEEKGTESVKDRIAGIWPFSPNKGKQRDEGDAHSHHHHKDKRIWIPSDTKVSLQVMWWGYRLYLPPPVLALLDDKRIEGAKRAAIITTALKWFLDHIPILMIPPPMHPAIKLLKGLVPYLGYIGAFVAWSWGAIKTFDKGHGVILTATWLLPLALIPGTWDDNDFPDVSVTAITPKNNPESSPLPNSQAISGQQIPIGDPPDPSHDAPLSG